MQFIVAVMKLDAGRGGGIARAGGRIRTANIIPERLDEPQPLGGNFMEFSSKERPNRYYTNQEDAEREAMRLAETTPGMNYGVFAPVMVFEARKSKVEFVTKEVNGSGELVVKPPTEVAPEVGLMQDFP